MRAGNFFNTKGIYMMNLRNKIKILFDKQDNLNTKLSYAYQYARIVQDLDKIGSAKKCLDSVDKFLKDKSEKNKADLKLAYGIALIAVNTFSNYAYIASLATDEPANSAACSAGSANSAACSVVESVTNATAESRDWAKNHTAFIACYASESADHIEKLEALTDRLNKE